MTTKQERVSDKCPRCGDMFYDPKTVIEDMRQHAIEWEEIAKKAESENRLKATIIEQLQRAQKVQNEIMDKELQQLRAVLPKVRGALDEAAYYCISHECSMCSSFGVQEYLVQALALLDSLEVKK